jgi:hypothetical protein
MMSRTNAIGRQTMNTNKPHKTGRIEGTPLR